MISKKKTYKNTLYIDGTWLNVGIEVRINEAESFW